MLKFLFEYLFSILLGIFPGMQLLGPMEIVWLTYWGTSKLFSTALLLKHSCKFFHIYYRWGLFPFPLDVGGLVTDLTNGVMEVMPCDLQD